MARSQRAEDRLSRASPHPRAASRRRARPDPVRLEVFHQLLAALCDESGAVLQRGAVSPNIRERRDFSVALFDADGRLIAQAAHIPVHLGSAAASVAAVRARLTLRRGDLAVLNDPYAGGTHLPDVTMVRPVFVGRAKAPRFFVVNRAHHADIGGATPGSMAAAQDLHSEGLVIPPVKLHDAGRPVADVLAMIAANVRGAAERTIDLDAQAAALQLADRRLVALCEEHGLRTVESYAQHLCDYAEAIARDVVARIPPGEYRAADQLDDDGFGNGPHQLGLTLRVGRGLLDFDYRESGPQAQGGINANPSVVLAASVYVLRCLCPDRLPTNDGLFRVVRVRTARGSLLDPIRPAAVAGGNVETSQRLVDLALQALGPALPELVPACSAGTMANLTIGGRGPTGFGLYETLPGGAGAGPSRDASSAIQTHMTNTRNTPIEETELRCPLRVTTLTVRRGSGGRGARRGGDGLVKELELIEPATVSLFAERALSAPCGAAGGGEGRRLVATVTEPGKPARRMPAKFSAALPAGARLRIETPGGGGHGAPAPAQRQG